MTEGVLFFLSDSINELERLLSGLESLDARCGGNVNEIELQCNTHIYY